MANPLYDNLIGEHATNDACFLRQPGKPAVSFRQFSERTSQVANLLLKHGLKPGDRVAVQASKTIEWSSCTERPFKQEVFFFH